METIKVKYHNKSIPKLAKIKVGDWIDLYAAESITLSSGDDCIIPLGVSMKLPEGYEATLAPRSSTFKKYGIIQTNGWGVIDNTFSGENDIWGMPVLAMRETTIHEGDRICQFRIVQKMPEVSFEEVAFMEDDTRGGFGSTGNR
ncbi:MAG: deoxyuridine 5'-triphosphate nucleotidohydrolase [Acinetobacter sp.]